MCPFAILLTANSSLQLFRTSEFKDDSHIIPRSSSVLVKRVFVRPGKGKAAMYIGNTASPSATPDSSSKTGGGSSASNSWHRGTGNISKRFDVVKAEKEAASSASKLTPVSAERCCFNNFVCLIFPQPIQVKSAVTKDDEAAAMAAMFQAQTANWEETQEKMSQLVSRLCGFPVDVVELFLMHVILFSVRFVAVPLWLQCCTHPQQRAWRHTPRSR